MLYKIHFSSHATIQLRNCPQLLHRKREDNTSKRWFLFWLSVISWGTHLLSLFTFPICFKCQMTVKQSMLSSSATSRVVVRGSVSTIALSWSLSTSSGQPPRPHLHGSCFFAKLLEPALHCTFISSSWARCVTGVASCLCCFTIHFELK